ncbi:DUF1828 domain-containing protein [Staphylococcus epidermidis]|uniref:DUF1828 domain-containing protein n=1 Tax=Staphylococcus epidermidis TaxID=1282 RepID=UPI000299434A|nr:DUF1828 domain-containing protein [Staphylococcus epidermidis]EKS40653.1 hypothetical protein HMPREF9281_00190 [Staphylococcus epidermidis BVS058A4]MCD8854828.1 DUF1828 domain-containing protein [Staphylococcus epidermidis]MCG1252278.1 DUF1828 domain-containing protein [Staphylococcus epidermidis]MCG1253620.1 DUF1828 domain-containing protein [Staphylococcus epidermidis]MCG1406508.1 DUF1828 domain-containing protein [Staphylococcus epidermidis]
MTTFDANKLKKEYLEWYNQELEFSNLSNNVVRIDSPFKDNTLDNLIIYALYDQTRDLITLTDDGYTIFGLENNGIFINKSKKRKKIFEEHLSAYGVKYNDITHEIYVKANFKTFNKSKHNLLQCLIFVNDMYILSKPKVQNIFSEDVANKLDEHNISYGRDLPIVGTSGVVHSFDFFISAKKNQKEKFINAISHPNNPMIIKSKVTDAIQAKKIKRHRPNEFIFILNDMNKEVNEQNKNLLHENNISTIDYSKLDEKIYLLT